MLVFKVAPSEFWSMTVPEWWTLYEFHEEQMDAATAAAKGNRRLSSAKLDQLHAGLRAAEEAERAGK